MVSNTMQFLSDNFAPGTGIRPATNWINGEEGVDFLTMDDMVDDLGALITDILDIAADAGLPGSQISVWLALVPALAIIPLKWVVAGIEISLWDVLFIFWMTYILPIPSIGVLGFSVPVPIGALFYLISKDCQVPFFGDGTITLPHSEDPTYFSNETDGTFTFRDMYLDLFILWIIEKVGKHFGRDIVSIIVRVILWGASHRQVHAKHILARIKDPSVTTNYIVGYDAEESEETLFELNEKVDELVNEFYGEMDTRDEGEGKSTKDYIRLIRGFRGLL